jgi:hypothetical protein
MVMVLFTCELPWWEEDGNFIIAGSSMGGYERRAPLFGEYYPLWGDGTQSHWGYDGKFVIAAGVTSSVASLGLVFLNGRRRRIGLILGSIAVLAMALGGYLVMADAVEHGPRLELEEGRVRASARGMLYGICATFGAAVAGAIFASIALCDAVRRNRVLGEGCAPGEPDARGGAARLGDRLPGPR